MNAAQAKRYTELCQCGYQFDHIDEHHQVRMMQWDRTAESSRIIREVKIMRDGSVVPVEPIKP